MSEDSMNDEDNFSSRFGPQKMEEFLPPINTFDIFDLGGGKDLRELRLSFSIPNHDRSEFYDKATGLFKLLLHFEFLLR